MAARAARVRRAAGAATRCCSARSTSARATSRATSASTATSCTCSSRSCINQHLWLALARGEAEPLETILRELPPVPPDNAWATFLRNHDELTLDQLTGPQRDEVFAAFAPDEDMRLYGHGIRRRAAPMLGGDPDRLRMAWSLMFSLPGAPMMFYGDEIGMGENLRARRADGRARPDAVVDRAQRRLLERAPKKASCARSWTATSAPARERRRRSGATRTRC